MALERIRAMLRRRFDYVMQRSDDRFEDRADTVTQINQAEQDARRRRAGLRQAVASKVGHAEALRLRLENAYARLEESKQVVRDGVQAVHSDNNLLSGLQLAAQRQADLQDEVKDLEELYDSARAEAQRAIREDQQAQAELQQVLRETGRLKELERQARDQDRMNAVNDDRYDPDTTTPSLDRVREKVLSHLGATRGLHAIRQIDGEASLFEIQRVTNTHRTDAIIAQAQAELETGHQSSALSAGDDAHSA